MGTRDERVGMGENLEFLSTTKNPIYPISQRELIESVD
jgi:hypothetical protein